MSFFVLHSQDGDQLLVPRSFLPDFHPVQSDVRLTHDAKLIKLLVSHLIERSKCIDATQLLKLDLQWFSTLEPAQYVPMSSLTEHLRLGWASDLIASHIARVLRTPHLDWPRVEQTWRAMA
jgi:hypothetical protein